MRQFSRGACLNCVCRRVRAPLLRMPCAWPQKKTENRKPARGTFRTKCDSCRLGQRSPDIGGGRIDLLVAPAVAPSTHSMETVIALLRNGGCTVKNVLSKYYTTSALMKPAFGAITGIEAFIAPLQWAAVYYNWSVAGTQLPGIIAAALDGAMPSDDQWLDAIAVSGTTAAAAAARSSLQAATAARQQNARVKVCKLIIGTAFVMLALDSMHISYGAAIMWAVLFLECALIYLLGVMFRGVMAERKAAADKQRLAAALSTPAIAVQQLEAPAALPLLHGAAVSLGNDLPALPTPPWAAQPAGNDPFGRRFAAALARLFWLLPLLSRTAASPHTSAAIATALPASTAVSTTLSRPAFRASSLSLAVRSLSPSAAFAPLKSTPVTTVPVPILPRHIIPAPSSPLLVTRRARCGGRPCSRASRRRRRSGRRASRRQGSVRRRNSSVSRISRSRRCGPPPAPSLVV